MVAEGYSQAHAAEESTDRLVAGLHDADPEAAAQLWDRYAKPLHAYVTRRLHGDADTAEDLLVQTLADAARNIATFNPRKSEFRAWLFGIARRQANLELRRRGRHASTVRLEDLTEQPGSLNWGEYAQPLHAKQQVARLRASLSDSEFEVLLLHCVHEFSIEEIGAILRRSRRAVNSLLYRARQKARERLDEDD